MKRKLSVEDRDPSEVVVGEHVLAAYKFMQSLRSIVKALSDSDVEGLLSYSDVTLESLKITLSDENLTKKISKSFVADKTFLKTEEKALSYMENEAEEASKLGAELEDLNMLIDEQGADLDLYRYEKINAQKKKIEESEKSIAIRFFESLATLTNDIFSKDTSDSEYLRQLFAKGQGTSISDVNRKVAADDLAEFVKSYSNKKTQKLLKRVQKKSAESSADISDEESSWEDMNSMIDVLESYGCLVKDSSSPPSYTISNAGEDVSMLNFDNSLWAIVAMGGSWDQSGTPSRKSDFFDDAFDDIFGTDEDELFPAEESQPIELNSKQRAREEAFTTASELTQRLLGMVPSEMAGYVSCLVTEESRTNDAFSLMDTLDSLTPNQRGAIELASLSGERLSYVQWTNRVDPSVTCRLQPTTCAVVTEWASGCSWQEAIELSGLAPGDLVRVLQRAMDALRQFGNLSFHPIRAVEAEASVSPGIHPDVRKICRDAAIQMDRYPIKDALSFIEDDENENDNDDDINSGDDTDDNSINLE